MTCSARPVGQMPAVARHGHLPHYDGGVDSNKELEQAGDSLRADLWAWGSANGRRRDLCDVDSRNNRKPAQDLEKLASQDEMRRCLRFLWNAHS